MSISIHIDPYTYIYAYIYLNLYVVYLSNLYHAIYTYIKNFSMENFMGFRPILC